MHRILPTLVIVALLAACGSEEARPRIPTAGLLLATATPEALIVAVAEPAMTPTTPPPPAAPAPAFASAQHEQYWRWMEEARAQHPYAETIDVMWAVMICESSGDPNRIMGPHYGLFQYLPDTWAGGWNPYRDQPILDPQAQIFATAKAWQDGNQVWWGCYR